MESFLWLNLTGLIFGSYQLYLHSSWFFGLLSINENPVFYSRTMLIIISVIYLIIYPWQIIGLWRSATNTTVNTGKTFWPRIVKFLVIIDVLGSFTAGMQDKRIVQTIVLRCFCIIQSQKLRCIR